MWRNIKLLLIITLYQASVYCTSPDSPASIPKPNVYELHVISDIQYRYATTVVSSRVVNPADVAQEIGFTVVLPETAFIAGFLMEIKGKVYNAYVKEKGEAKKTYDEAVSEGRGAAYVEQTARDSNQFTVSVNIEPHEKVNFNLTYEELLTRTLGTYNHVININPGQIVRDLAVTVNIKEVSNVTKVEVPKLQVSNEVIPDNDPNPLAIIDWKNSQTVSVRYAPTAEQQQEIAKDGINGQLTVKYDVDRENSQQILVNEGYFVHFFAPETLQPLPKHVVFVLDYSGSMLGRKIDQLKEAMATILSDLSAQDYFSLVIFSDSSESWSPSPDAESTNETTTTESNYPYYQRKQRPMQELGKNHIVSATPENIQLAKNHINTYSDFGGTNIISGLRDGLRLAEIGSELSKNNAASPQPMIIFLTDGQPNIEMSDPEEIIKKVKELNTKKVAIFSLAFGYGADFKFLRKLSLRNNAFARTIYEGADAAIQLKNFYKEVASPLLANIKFDYLPGQVDNTTSTRSKFPAFYYGSEIVVAGKLLPQENESIEAKENIEAGKLTARGSDGEHTFPIIICPPFPMPRPVKDYPVGPLEKVWAYLTIKQQLDEIETLTQESEVNATKSKALDLALKYKFVTPLTSLVVVKPNETKAVDAEQVRPEAHMQGQASAMSGMIMHKSMIISNSFLRSPSRPSFQVYPLSVQHPPAMAGESSRQSYDMEDSLDVTLDSDTETDKVPIDNLAWLSNYTSSDNTTVTLPLASGDAVFKLGHNQPDVSFGTCQLPNTNATGECRHLEYCALQVFETSFLNFVPYRCDITNGYLGTCCPTS